MSKCMIAKLKKVPAMAVAVASILAGPNLFGKATEGQSAKSMVTPYQQEVSYNPNRTPAHPWWFDAVVFLKNPSLDSIVCTGLLVDPRIVLTAAHCIYAIDSKEFLVLRTNAAGNTVQSIRSLPHYSYAHPDYRKRQNAIKKLKATTADPEKLPWDDVFNFEPDVALISLAEPMARGGFLDLPNNIARADQYHQFFSLGPLHPQPTTDVITPKVLAMTHERRSEDISEGFISLTTNRPDQEKICEGDSGGPVFGYNPDTKRFGLIGVIASFTVEEGPKSTKSCGAESKSEPLFQHRQWLSETLAFLQRELPLERSFRKRNFTKVETPQQTLPKPDKVQWRESKIPNLKTK